jgi:hypothetical protein
MNPIDKLRYHGVFPCKLFLNLLTLVFSGVLLLLYEVPIAVYQHNQKVRLSSRFMPAAYFSLNDDLTGIDDVRKLVSESVSQYYDGIRDEVNKFSPLSDQTGKAACPQMETAIRARSIRFTQNFDGGPRSRVVTSCLTPDAPLGSLETKVADNVTFLHLPESRQQMDALCAPRMDSWSGDWYVPCRGYSFSPAMAVAASMNNMRDDSFEQVRVTFSLIATDVDVPFQAQRATYLWNIVQTFDFHGGSGQVTAMVALSGERLDRQESIVLRVLLGVSLLTCCVWDTGLRIRVFYRFKQFRDKNPAVTKPRNSYKLFGTEEDIEVAVERADVPTTSLSAKELSEEKVEEEEFAQWLLAAENSRRSRHSALHRRRTASRVFSQHGSTSPENLSIAIESGDKVPGTSDASIGENRTVRFIAGEQETNKDGNPLKNNKGAQGPESSSSTDSSWTTSSSCSSSDTNEQVSIGFHSMSETYLRAKEKKKGAGQAVRRQKSSPLLRQNRVINVNTMGAKWMILGIGADLFLISGAFFLIADLYQWGNTAPLLFDYVRQLLLGVGSMCCSVLLLSYFRHSPRYYVLIEAMSRGMPRVFVFIFINVFPIFFSFVFFGVIVFGWYVPEMRTITKASISLVSLLGGDSLVRLFASASTTNSLLLLSASRCYTVAFICIFVYGVLNVTLAIVQDSYYFVKRKLYIMRDFEGKQALREAYRHYKRQRKNQQLPS